MRTAHFTVTARQVQLHTRTLLQRHLALADHGRKCTATLLYDLLCWAACRIASVAAACAALKEAPSDQAARDALLATLPEFLRLQRCLNQALADGLPKPLRRHRQRLALDLTLIPYYGQPFADPAELYGGTAKAGTRLFHAYATAYVIHRGCRWTVALRVVHQGDAWDAIVRDLLRQAVQAGVKARLVLLDRGSYSVAALRYLHAAALAAAAVCRGGVAVAQCMGLVALGSDGRAAAGAAPRAFVALAVPGAAGVVATGDRAGLGSSGCPRHATADADVTSMHKSE